MKEALSKVLVFAASYLVKIHRIEKGNFVTWDEAHFGKFSQKYLSRLFYFDVHPPLGKLMTALSGFIHGQTAAFDFSSSSEYPVKFDYVGMRRFHALVGSFTPLFAFLILREFKFSLRRALLLSLLFILENGITTISRLILLDSHLMAFTAGTAYCFALLYTRVHLPRAQKNTSENKVLALLGLFIGCVVSVKWIGCLTTLQVGLFIIWDLFRKLKVLDLKTYGRYFMKRAFYLILVPISFYVGMFYIHFMIVNRSGPDDGFMSSEFQLSLKGNPYKDLKKYVSFGNQVTIRATSGYLHSHFNAYPDYVDPLTGRKGDVLSKEELEKNRLVPLQATTYAHSDANNNFYFQKISEAGHADFVCDGDEIALLHNETKGYLQQSGESAYLSEGYKIIVNRQEGLDQLAVWIVEIASDSVKKEERVKAVSTKFYLRNKMTGMYLCAPDTKYPSWGFGQGEVCGVKTKNAMCLFNLQENFFSNAPNNVPYTELRPSFIKRFLEHQAVMFRVNKSFVADPDVAPEGIASRPLDWLFLTKGIRMSQWHDQFKFYMFYNPFLHWAANVCLLVAPLAVYFRYVLGRRRENAKLLRGLTAAVRLQDMRHEKHEEINEEINEEANEETNDEVFFNPTEPATGLKEAKGRKQNVSLQSDAFFLYLAVGGWILHFFPFFIVGRVLYMHHYFPALFFGTLNVCFLLKKRSFLFCVIFVGLVGAVFAAFAPLTYGFIDQEKIGRLKLLSSWNFTDK